MFLFNEINSYKIYILLWKRTTSLLDLGNDYLLFLEINVEI